MALKIDGTLLLAGAGNMGTAMLAGWLVGGLSLATTTGVVILGIAALCSLAVTSRMKREDKERKAWEAWQDYYVRMYPQYYQRR